MYIIRMQRKEWFKMLRKRNLAANIRLEKLQ